MKTITGKEAIEIIKNFIDDSLVKEEWYKSIQKYVEAIILYGSTVKGTNLEDSDIELLIIVPLKIEQKYTQEYSYNYGGYEINLVLMSIERLKKLAKEQNDLLQAEVFRKSEVIWEKNKKVRNFIEKIKVPKK
jgi:predicted nucleotidyltransferase